MLCHRLVYPSVDEEEEIVNQQLSFGLRIENEGAVPKSAFDMLTESPVTHINDLTEAMGKVQEVHVSDVFVRQCVELVRRTREHPNLEIGGSPRAAMALVQAARARALIHGRDYAIPDDLFALAEDVILHRIRLTYGALAEGATGADTLKEILVGVG
jgi:MoxR-like ATPase